MPRFVILRHEFPKRDVHWDFMLEQGETLRTWALTAEPNAGSEIPADVLPNHRLAYLDYEGPITGGRGTVKRWDCGQFEWLTDQPQEVCVKLVGDRITGTACLRAVATGLQRWIFDFSA